MTLDYQVFLEKYNLKIVRSELLKGGIEHDVFKLSTADSKYYVLKRYICRNLQEIEFELQILNNLAVDINMNVNVPRPIPILTNQSHKYISNNSVIYEYLDGEIGTSFSRKIIRELIDSCIQIHNCLQKRSYDKSIKNKRSKSIEKMARYLLKIDNRIMEQSIKNLILKEVNSIPFYESVLAKFPICVIHGDLTLKNILLAKDGSLKSIIDFDDASVDYTIMEYSSMGRNILSTKDKRNAMEMIQFLHNVLLEKEICNLSFGSFLDIVKYTCFRFFVYIAYCDIINRNISPISLFRKYPRDLQKIMYLNLYQKNK